MYLLTCEDTTKNARSLAYAKALAPYMFTRLGTRCLFKHILITNADGVIVASFGRKGWQDDPRGLTLSEDAKYAELAARQDLEEAYEGDLRATQHQLLENGGRGFQIEEPPFDTLEEMRGAA